VKSSADPRAYEVNLLSKVHTVRSIPKRILVPTDFSSSADAAFEMATELAQHFHAELVLLNVIPMFSATTAYDYFPETEFLEQARRFAETQFSSRQRALISKVVQAKVCIESGNDVAGTIMTVIDREDIDMVIISTHGISGWRPLVFGSIAEKAVKLVQCPILLLRSNNAETRA
jgi:nucleotide-binding universal stress UspA family protein